MTSRVIDALGASEVPDFWARSNWGRPYRFLETAAGGRDADAPDIRPRRFMYDKIVSGFNYQDALGRRSLTSDAGRSIPRAAFEAVLRSIYQILAEEPALVCGIITADVEGWADAAWIVDSQPRCIRQVPRPLLPGDLAKLIQGQAWGHGPGISIVLGAAWGEEAADQADLEYDYARTLVTMGASGQAILLEGQHHGLRARMTPALTESFAAEVFQLDETMEMLYAIRLSTPKAAV
jgi:hypothetical protein